LVVQFLEAILERNIDLNPPQLLRINISSGSAWKGYLGNLSLIKRLALKSSRAVPDDPVDALDARDGLS
jgi:hypothetical protein